ncbi:hypothetical protein H257_18916, partial [Aphanomyces astaci]
HTQFTFPLLTRHANCLRRCWFGRVRCVYHLPRAPSSCCCGFHFLHQCERRGRCHVLRAICGAQGKACPKRGDVAVVHCLHILLSFVRATSKCVEWDMRKDPDAVSEDE